MKCFTCKYYWYMLPCIESPYVEEACTKTEQDLYGCEPEDVADCEHYEKREDYVQRRRRRDDGTRSIANAGQVSLQVQDVETIQVVREDESAFTTSRLGVETWIHCKSSKHFEKTKRLTWN